MTVVAPAAGYRTSIDRRSYTIGDDLQKGSGSLADVLSHVPSVQVDMDGAVSLRGDSNVTILVDGKPSALFSGPSRSQAIQAISADQYERVEVMTNPPAGVTAEGGGGVINLITKAAPRGRPAATLTGQIKASVGTGDRLSGGVTGAYQAQGLSLSGGADFRRSGYLRSLGDRYRLTDPVSGAVYPAYGVADQTDHDDSLTIYGAAGLDLDPHDHLDANVNFTNDREIERQNSRYQTGVSEGPLALSYLGPGFQHNAFSNLSESLGLTRTLPGEGQNLAIKVSFAQPLYASQNGAAYDYVTPPQPHLYQDVAGLQLWPELDLKVDYTATLPNKAKLSLGYEGRVDWQTLGVQDLQGGTAATAAVNTASGQRFTLNQPVNALYATYEQPFGKLTVQPGVRLENTVVDSDLVPSSETWKQSYFEVYPSLHLDYALDDASQFKGSYGRRVERPDAFLLDPFRIYQSPTAYTAGNPLLRPAITQSFELAYEYKQHSTDLQATLFYRDKTNLFSTITQNIGGNVLLTTSQNIGIEHDIGVEFVANRDLFKTLTLNASTDLVRSDLDAENLGVAGVRSALVVSARTTLNWKATSRDFVQLGAEASGRQLTAQGYRGGSTFANIGWRHEIDSRLSFLATANNPFGLSRRTIDIDTPELIEIEKRKFNPVALFIGLTYAFGSAPKRSDKFDFGGSGKPNQ